MNLWNDCNIASFQQIVFPATTNDLVNHESAKCFPGNCLDKLASNFCYV